MQIKFFVFNPISVNTYIVWDEKSLEGVLIDCGALTKEERHELSSFIEENSIDIKALWNTHLHLDHCFGNQWAAQKFGVELWAHQGDEHISEQMMRMAPMYGVTQEVHSQAIGQYITDGQKLSVGSYSFDCLHVPGHSKGSICFYCEEEGVLFSGDVLFQNSIGRTDLPGGNYEELIEGIQNKIKCLPDNTTICCGHGPITLLSDEKKYNSFLNL